MDTKKPIVLDYKTPEYHPWFRWPTRREVTFCTTLIGVVVLLLHFASVGGVTSAYVSVDCGDICYTYYGIPTSYRQTPEPRRTELLSVSRASPKLAGRWVELHLRRFNAAPEMLTRWFYDQALTPWLANDRTLCRLAMEDAADELGKSHLFASSSILQIDELYVDLLFSNPPLLKPDWKSNPQLRAYAFSHGYTIP